MTVVGATTHRTQGVQSNPPLRFLTDLRWGRKTPADTPGPVHLSVPP